MDVRQLVIGAMDKVVGRELDGVLLPKPLLSATALEWPAKHKETAAEQIETTAVQQTTTEDASEKADEAPKAPSELIASVVASIKKKKQVGATDRSNKADGIVARVLAGIKQKQVIEESRSRWSGGGGRVLGYILEGMTL